MVESKRVPVGELRPAPWNPRTIREERFKNLCASLQADPEFLERRPILALADGTVYAGNMRLRAALHLGWAAVPAVLEDVDERLAKERALRDNAQWGEWQEDDLAGFVFDLRTDGADLSILGFDPKELTRLLDASGALGDTGLDVVPEPPAEPITRPGDLWLLGPHRLLCGDATRPEDVARLMGGQTAACLWTDPPYGVEYVGKTDDALTISNDHAAGLRALLVGALQAATPHLQSGAPFYLASPPGWLATEFRLAIRDAGWQFHQALVWVKDAMVLGHSDYHFQHEDILYGWLPGPGRSGRGNHQGSRWYGDHSQTSVFVVDRPKRSEQHPTMKPPELVRQQIQNSSERGAIILDLFSGSGSTLAACHVAGRVSYGLEIDPVYCDVTVRRWEYLTGETATREDAA